MLVIVAADRGHVLSDRANDLAAVPAWNRPPLADPVVIPLPGGGTVVIRAVDIKRDPADTLIAAPATR